MFKIMKLKSTCYPYLTAQVITLLGSLTLFPLDQEK